MSFAQKHLVVATAGHIDHGKTALVRTLTGMETDRLAEEQQRGITIELGYAFLGDHITIIDVPGHERFIKTMVAGVSTVDLALLVVAADDGIMPQTREHLDILTLLRIPALFVVITKIAGQETDWIDLVEEDMRDLLPDAYRAETRFFRCDSLSGQGIDDLRAAIEDYAAHAPVRRDRGVFRLPVDRAFSLKGHGTVITGTVLEGEVQTGQTLEVQPDGFEVRVRGQQCHGEERKTIGAGERAAINLIGPDVDRIRRGHWICQKNQFIPTEAIDLELTTVSTAPLLKNRDRVRLHIGADEVIGRLILFGNDLIQPGERGFAQFKAEKPLLAVSGDRVILRRYSPLDLIGGGRVLDPQPLPKRRSDPAALAAFRALAGLEGEAALLEKIHLSGARGVALREALSFSHLPENDLLKIIDQQHSRGHLAVVGSGEQRRFVSQTVMEAARQRIVGLLEDYHHAHPQQLGLKPVELVQEMQQDFIPSVIETVLDELRQGPVRFEKGYLHLAGHQITLDDATDALSRRIEEHLEEAGYTPPDQAALQKALKAPEADLNRALSVMSQQERVVRTGQGPIWSKPILRRAWEVVKPLLLAEAGRSMSELREALDCPRRYAVSLIEVFDQMKLTDRREDRRYPGPDYDDEL